MSQREELMLVGKAACFSYSKQLRVVCITPVTQLVESTITLYFREPRCVISVQI